MLPSFGITKDGFNRKNYLEIINDMNALARELFGEDIDVSERSPFGMSLQNVAWEIRGLWELAEDVYNSAYIDTSEGLSLDGVGKYIAISRKPAQRAIGEVKIEGNEGIVIPLGFRVSTENTNIIFETTARKVIGPELNAVVPIRALVAGLEGNLPINTITKVVNPLSGVNKVYNLKATNDGTEMESDKDFRERYYRSVSLGGSSTRESVESVLLNMEEVTDAFVEENTTMLPIGDVPPKSLAPYVFGGVDEDIANVILDSKAGGIRSFGTTEIEVEDSKGIKHIIGFTRPTVKDVYVKMTITREVNYPGDDVIKSSVLNYIGGQDLEGTVYKGLKLGEDVVISKLMSTATCQSGVADVVVEVSTDGVSYISSNIVISKNEIARTSIEKVEITYAP